jgi:hypothetical protein
MKEPADKPPISTHCPAAKLFAAVYVTTFEVIENAVIVETEPAAGPFHCSLGGPSDTLELPTTPSIWQLSFALIVEEMTYV